MRSSLVLVLLVLISQAATAQQAPSAATRLTVSGVVTASDDTPLPRVRVTAPDAPSSDPVLTDARGQFQLRVADAPSVRLAVSKTGYLTFALDVPTRVSNEQNTGLRVRLVRAGAISGRVTDQRGAPLRVTVSARRAGSPATATPLSTNSNDLGEYRFGGLSEGAYIVSARPPADPVGGPEARAAELKSPAVEAAPTNVRAGQESNNVNLTINLATSTTQRTLTGATARSDSAATASISGRVVGHDGLPIAGASVFTMQGQGGRGWSTETDANGRYRIDRLVAGTHTVTALKNGYLSQAYGQVALLADQEVRAIDITLSRGGAITGTIVDEFGEPVEGIAVDVRQIVTVEGGRLRVNPQNLFLTGFAEQLQLFGGGSAAPFERRTDDRGQYRIFGLRQGTYVVQAVVRERSPSVPASLPLYYPGTAVIDQATKVNLPADAEATGIDLIFRPERGYQIGGTVTHADGRPARLTVTLFTSDRSRAIDTGPVATQTETDGSFTFRDVAPGDYVVQTGPGRPSQSTVRASAAGGSEFGAAFVTVRNADAAPVAIGLLPATTLTGRVTYDGQPPTSRNIPLTLRSLDRDRGPRTAVTLPGFPGNRNGTFELGGLVGLTSITARSPQSAWYVKSIMVNGRDILDAAYDFGSGQTIADAEVIVSAMAATVTGRVTDDRLAPVRDCVVVIVSASSAKWVSDSQWVKTARPVQNGTFTIPGMPPGDYLIAALDPADDDGTGVDPGLLESLASRATRISLNQGQTHDVPLRLIRR